MSFPTFAEEALEDLFDPLTLERAYGYVQRVADLRLTQNGALYAQVRGTRSRPYLCTVRLRRIGERLRLEGQCTCPVGYACKHMAAVLLAWVGQRRAAVAPPRLTPLVHVWLDELDQAVGEAAASTAASREQLLYLFSFDSAGRLRLGLQVAQRLQDGSWGKPRRYAGLHGERPAFLSAEDVHLLLRWQAMHWNPDEAISPEWGAGLLESAIRTGRAYWQRIAGPALRLGDPIPGNIVWRTDDHGAQRVVVETAAGTPIVFPLLPPWYLDAEAGRCGPLLSELPERAALLLLRAPAVPPEDAALLSEELGQLSRRLGAPLPAPATLTVHAREVAPIPCLHLDGTELKLPARGRARAQKAQVEYARLRFDYAGHEVKALESRLGSVSGRIDGEYVTMRRRGDLEAQAFGQLSAWLEPGPELDGDDELFFVAYDEDEWLDFLIEGLPQLRSAGWKITEGSGSQPRVAQPTDWHGEIEEGADWFALGLDVEVDGQRVPVLPLVVDAIRHLPEVLNPDAIRRLERPVLTELPDGRLLPLPPERLKPLLTTLFELFQGTLDERGQLRLPRVKSPLLADLDSATGLGWHGGNRLRELGERMRDFAGIAPVEPPSGLHAVLRGYQREGLSWLQFLRAYDLGGVLADDMGLGKTVQTLAHILLEKAAGRLDRPALVVAPTSLMLNWRREAERFAPGLRVLTLHGLARHERFEHIGEHDLVLTTYPLLPRDEAVLAAQEFHLLILDEAQNIKNARSKAAQVARGLNARHRLCLTGTPMENHLGELWSLFQFLMPGLLGDEQEFRRIFRTPIEKRGDAERREALSKRVGPFLLRRTKEAVATELPPKTEIVRSVEITGAQRDLYEAVRLAMSEKVRTEIAKKGVDRSRIVILDALLKLRQICCDPRLLKLSAAGKVKDSAKLALLMELLPEMVDEGRRILLFSQFTSMLSLIEEALSRAGIPYLLLTGSTRDRETPINRFQSGEVPVFLISLKAGGVGLNLTAADTVIHYDPWWNPAVERQATDRAHRIGQDKPVFVYKLMTAGTVEEKINELQARKRELADAIFDEGAAHGAALTGDDLSHLFDPLG